VNVKEMMANQAELAWTITGNIGFGVALYIYLALCMYFIAKKTQTPNDWMAWVPIANLLLMFMVAKKPWWWILLMLIPIVNIVVIVITWMEIAKARGKSGVWGLLLLVPLLNLLVPGYVAFSD
jgi:uncharacterized protein DUF5684